MGLKFYQYNKIQVSNILLYVVSGYDKSPPKISFSLLSFDDETSFLCALDTNNTIYYYSSSSYWVKIDSGFIHVSVGRNGMWAVDTNNRIHNRMGVSYASPQGTYWNQIDMTTYGTFLLLTLNFHMLFYKTSYFITTVLQYIFPFNHVAFTVLIFFTENFHFHYIMNLCYSGV